MRKIGLLGGTFAPIHTGHIHIALKSKKSLSLDEIWVIVDGIPPHKEDILDVSRFHRYEMARLAFLEYPHIHIKDLELYDMEKSYTVDTLGYIRKKYPEDKFYFIMGEDSLDKFSTWYKPDEISSLADILVAARSDCDMESIDEKVRRLKGQFPGDFITISYDHVDIASSKLREYLRNGKEEKAGEFIPKEVMSYIKSRRIFWTEQVSFDEEEITTFLKQTLDRKRYYHSHRVADTAFSLADNYLFPSKTAYAAGLMHDCGKYMTETELIDFCRERKITITRDQMKAPYLLHAPAGAFIASDKFGVDDEEFLNAIRYHTTGRPAMSLLEKIIFVADYIEPGRKRSKLLEKIRPMAYKNIDVAVYMILKETIEFVGSKGNPIDETATAALKYYEGEINGRS